MWGSLTGVLLIEIQCKPVTSEVGVLAYWYGVASEQFDSGHDFSMVESLSCGCSAVNPPPPPLQAWVCGWGLKPLSQYQKPIRRRTTLHKKCCVVTCISICRSGPVGRLVLVELSQVWVCIMAVYLPRLTLTKVY